MDFAEIKELIFTWRKKRGVEAVEIYYFNEKGLKIAKKDRTLETFQPYEEKALALRVIHQGARGFAYTSALKPDDLYQAAEKALEMALVMPKEEASFPQPQDYPGLTPPEAPLISTEEALSKLDLMEEKAFSLDSRIKRIQEVALRDQKGTLYLANTNGVDVSWPYRAFSLMALVIAGANGEAQMGWEWKVALTPQELSPEEISVTAAERALARLGAKPMASSRLPVILPPHLAVDFLELVSEAFSGENVLKGKSALAGQKGKRIFSSKINLYDNGVLVGAIGSRPFDDEGFAQQETVLVKEGTVQGFLFDHYWAKRAGESSTGNARRNSFKSPPGVGLTNFYLAPGEYEPAELRSTFSQVFEVIEVLGMHTADPVSGDFSVGVAGLLHTSEGSTPVSGMALSGNVFELFKRVEALGNDLTFYGNLGSPSILIEALDLAGG